MPIKKWACFHKWLPQLRWWPKANTRKKRKARTFRAWMTSVGRTKIIIGIHRKVLPTFKWHSTQNILRIYYENRAIKASIGISTNAHPVRPYVSNVCVQMPLQASTRTNVYYWRHTRRINKRLPYLLSLYSILSLCVWYVAYFFSLGSASVGSLNLLPLHSVGCFLGFFSYRHHRLRYPRGVWTNLALTHTFTLGGGK